MPATWVTSRVWVAGERVGASKMNEISTDLGVLYPYTTAGDLAYRDAAGAYLSRLALVAGSLLYGGASAPAYLPLTPGDIVFRGASLPTALPKGAARAKLGMNVAGTYPEWVDTILAEVGRTTSDTVNNAIYHPMAWNSEILDIGGVWDAGSNTRFTIPRTGHYMIGSKIEFDANATGSRELKIYKNGIQTYYEASGPGLSGVSVRLNISGHFYATAGDYFEFYVWQNSGAGISVSANRCFAWLFDLGL